MDLSNPNYSFTGESTNGLIVCEGRDTCKTMINTSLPGPWFKALGTHGPRRICLHCKTYYDQKKLASQGNRPQNLLPFTTPKAPVGLTAPVNLPAIKKQTAAAQRNPATGNSQVARLSATPGYTPVHQNYEVIAAASKAQAYRSNRDSISFTTSLSFLTRKKVGNEVIKGIYKTIAVPVDIRPTQLKQACYNALKDLIVKWAGIHAPDIDHVRLTRGKAEFLDDPSFEDQPIIYQDCYSAPNAKTPKGRQVGQLRKQLTKTDSPYLSITEDEFDDILARLQEETLVEEDYSAGTQSKWGSDHDDHQATRATIPSKPRKRTRNTMEADLLSLKVSPLETARSSRNSGTRSNPQRRPRPGKATNPIPVDDDDRNDDDEEEDLPQLPQAKRRAAETSSSKNGRPLFLPPSEVNGGCSAGGSLGALPVGFNFGEALRVLGGSAKAKDDANFVKKALSVTIYPLAYPSLTNLLEQGNQTGTVFHEDTAAQGKLEILEYLNTGSFKTANHGKLSHQAILQSNHDTILSHAQLIVKQPFLRQSDGRQQSLPASHSLDSLTVAARELQCANALMRMTYDHIEKAVGKGAMPHLPKVKFVAAGVAVATDTRRAYLLEEYIDPQVHGPFVKYISNNSSKVLTVFLSDHEEQDRGLFLAATQHVQYEVTNGFAFVSDLQGAGGLLTNPQILTHPDLGDLFGDGNVSRTWGNFKTDHTCNKYCDMFKLLPYGPTKSKGLKPQEKGKLPTSTRSRFQPPSIRDDQE